MTGRIKILTIGNPSGLIQTENGLSVNFDVSAVLAYDATCLAPGQLVTFDIENPVHPKAVNVCVRREHLVSQAREQRHDAIYVRYAGFEQQKDMRVFRFDRIAMGGDTITLTVAADLRLFTAHHVAIQEGPALCMQVLMLDASTLGAAGPSRLQRSLTDQDMLAHLANCPSAQRKPHRKRILRSRTATSHTG